MTNFTYILATILATVLTTCIYGTIINNEAEDYSAKIFTICGSQIADAMSLICPGNYYGYDKRSTWAHNDINSIAMKRRAYIRYFKKWEPKLLFDLLNKNGIKRNVDYIATTCCVNKNCTFNVLHGFCKPTMLPVQLTEIARNYFSSSGRRDEANVSENVSQPPVQEPPTTTIGHGYVIRISESTGNGVSFDVRNMILK